MQSDILIVCINVFYKHICFYNLSNYVCDLDLI
jgi:hypothetical protein